MKQIAKNMIHFNISLSKFSGNFADEMNSKPQNCK